MKKVYLFILFPWLIFILPASGLQGSHSFSGGSAAANYSIRFYGPESNDWDRIKMPLDNPPTSVDVEGNFTIEFWMKAGYNENSTGIALSSQDGWILGHIIYDRDNYGVGDYGISMGKDLNKDPSGKARYIAFEVDRQGVGNGIVGRSPEK
jgi:hypothetical protein